MSESDQTNESSEQTPELEAAANEAQAEAPDKKDDAEQDEDEAKPAKPKKVKVGYEATMPRNEAVSYFEAIVGGLRSGRLEFRQEGDTLVLSPPDQLEIEVKAQRKGDKAKVVFEIEWSDELRNLEIVH